MRKGLGAVHAVHEAGRLPSLDDKLALWYRYLHDLPLADMKGIRQSVQACSGPRNLQCLLLEPMHHCTCLQQARLDQHIGPEPNVQPAMTTKSDSHVQGMTWAST